MKQVDNPIGKQVEARYRKYAEAVLASDSPLPFNVDGSAPQTGTQSARLAERLYTKGELIDLPTPVVNASIGCGNPVALADIKPGEHVLDMGSGGGIDCFMAAKAVGPNGHVIGVDVTPAMIDLATKNKAEMGVTNAEFRLGNIEKLPVESNSIDLILSNCVIDISPNKDAVFQEAFRVLKPGGRIAISDTVLSGVMPQQLKANIDIWAGAVVTPLITLSEFIQFMIDANFIDIKVASLISYGLENYEQLDSRSQEILTNGMEWTPLPPNTGLYSASIWARKW